MHVTMQVSFTDLMQETIQLAEEYLVTRGYAVAHRGKAIVPQAKIAEIVFDYLGTVELNPERIQRIHADSLINTQTVRETSINFEPKMREVVNALGQRVEAVCGKLRGIKKKDNYNLTLMLVIGLVLYVQDVVLPAMPEAKIDVLSKLGQPRLHS